MFNRPHHRRIAKILRKFDSQLLMDLECFFCGGTAIVLLLGEYRESVDIDFICSSKEGYKNIRNIVSKNNLGILLKEEINYMREVRSDMYGIRTFVEIEDEAVKIEIINEGRMPVTGSINYNLAIPVLCQDDMYAEKLLANTDRGLDKATWSRDIIDLAIMIKNWGSIPLPVWQKVLNIYGQASLNSFTSSIKMVNDKSYLLQCLKKMSMDEILLEDIPIILNNELIPVL